jgi:hypothetical protein
MTVDITKKRRRIAKANQVLEIIASHGSHFFRHHDDISRLELGEQARIWLVDSGTGKKVYTAFVGSWKNFSDGYTMRVIVVNLCRYIHTGELVAWQLFGPWPHYDADGDPWGYGESMDQVRAEVRALGILTQLPEQVQ